MSATLLVSPTISWSTCHAFTICQIIPGIIPITISIKIILFHIALYPLFSSSPLKWVFQTLLIHVQWKEDQKRMDNGWWAARSPFETKYKILGCESTIIAKQPMAKVVCLEVSVQKLLMHLRINLLWLRQRPYSVLFQGKIFLDYVLQVYEYEQVWTRGR